VISVWFFHRGALGDSVLLWPRLRLLRTDGCAVTLVSDASKARLAARELGIAHEHAEHPRFHALWRTQASSEPVRGVSLVIDYVGPSAGRGAGSTDLTEEPSRRWHENLARMFPGAEVESSQPPTGADARRLCDSDPRAMPTLRVNHGGPIVLHVGAGSEAKRWPLDRWVALAKVLRDEGRTVMFIAGEVEAERFAASDRRSFDHAGGRFLESLDELADTLRCASVFVGCDSGPSHLAAQLGVPTVALFGPTDPAVWGPVGPRVVVVRDDSKLMEALAVSDAAGAIGETARGRLPLE